MQTLKIKYKTSEENLAIIKEYQRQYSSCLHYFYNRIQEGLDEKQCRFLFSKLNNINKLDFIFKECAIKDAIQVYKSFQIRYNDHKTNREENLEELKRKFLIGKVSKEKYLEKRKNILKELTLIFGGKKNYFDRQKGNITVEQFKDNKLSPLYIIGRKNLPFGNQKFKLTEDLNINFYPNRKTKIELQLNNYLNYKQILQQLYSLGLNKQICITYKLDQNYVYISFDESELKTYQNNQIQNRVLALDLNPNYIGWSIVDWKSENQFDIVKTGIYSIKGLNDKDFSLKGKGYSSESKERIYLSNKRNYETLQIAKNIINKAIYYKCQIVSIEDLKINSDDKNKGKKFNKLVNNLWNRNALVNNLTKRCNIFNIKLIKVKPEYSSFIGNFLYRSLNLPDMILASIELGRRAYEFYNQYISKTKEQKKNIIQPDIKLFNNLIIKSLEEFNIQRGQFKDLKELYYIFKKSKIMYRLSINQIDLQFSSLNSHNNSFIKVINDYKCY